MAWQHQETHPPRGDTVEQLGQNHPNLTLPDPAFHHLVVLPRPANQTTTFAAEFDSRRQRWAITHEVRLQGNTLVFEARDRETRVPDQYFAPETLQQLRDHQNLEEEEDEVAEALNLAADTTETPEPTTETLEPTTETLEPTTEAPESTTATSSQSLPQTPTTRPPPSRIPRIPTTTTRATSSQVPTVTPTPMATSKPIDIHVKVPTVFDGDRTKVTKFLQDVQVFMLAHKDGFKDEERKVLFTLSYMDEGVAETWKQAFLSNAFTIAPGAAAMNGFGTWAELETKILKDFQPESVKVQAARDILTIKQGTKKASEYIAEFKVIAGLTGIPQYEMISNFFLNGLQPALGRKILAMNPFPDDMTKLYDAATRLDAQWEREKAIYGNRQPKKVIRTAKEETTTATVVNAMQPLPKLTPELRKELRDKGGCYRCRQLGHFANNCPLNNSKPSPPKSSTSSTSSTTPSVEKVRAMILELPEDQRPLLMDF